MADEELIIIGASARAAAFSASRAGFRPWWIDQFGDSDLSGAFPGRRVAPADYPSGIPDLMDEAPAVPWMYTGALENHAGVLERLAGMRPLLGNDRAVCERVRNPWLLKAVLDASLVACADIAAADDVPPGGGTWLQKPVRGAGGLGIGEYAGGRVPAGHYLQRRVPGAHRSAVFLGDGRTSRLVAVTGQLVGAPEFHAGPFSYCGSLGPLPLEEPERAQWQAAGDVIAGGFQLRGLFGVDAVIDEGLVTVIEVNPRYTASVEIIERVLELPLVRLHRDACAGSLPAPGAGWSGHCMGKAYLFAPFAVDIPDPQRLVGAVAGVEVEPADIPPAGSRIVSGAPIMTLLVTAGDATACARLLSGHAGAVYRALE